jgi:hypothetical protein
MYFRGDERPRAERPGTWIFGQEFRYQDYFKGAPCLVEFIPITGNAGGPLPLEYMKPGVTRDGHKGGHFRQTKHDADSMWFYCGTDRGDPENLGAHIEFHMGDGEDAAVFEFDSPRCVYVPKGVTTGPVIISNFHRMFYHINVFTQPTKEACYIEHHYMPIPHLDQD